MLRVVKCKCGQPGLCSEVSPFFVCATPWPTIMMIFRRVRNHISSLHFGATWQKFGGISLKTAGEFGVHATAGEETGATLEKPHKQQPRRTESSFALYDRFCLLFLAQPRYHSAEPSASSATVPVGIFPSKHYCLTKHIWRAALTKAGLHLGFRVLVAHVCVSEAPVIYTEERKFARDTRHTLMQIWNAFFFFALSPQQMFWNIMSVQHVIHVWTGEMYVRLRVLHFDQRWNIFVAAAFIGKWSLSRTPTDSQYITAQSHWRVRASQVLTSKCWLSPFISSWAS